MWYYSFVLSLPWKLPYGRPWKARIKIIESGKIHYTATCIIRVWFTELLFFRTASGRSVYDISDMVLLSGRGGPARRGSSRATGRATDGARRVAIRNVCRPRALRSSRGVRAARSDLARRHLAGPSSRASAVPRPSNAARIPRNTRPKLRRGPRRHATLINKRQHSAPHTSRGARYDPPTNASSSLGRFARSPSPSVRPAIPRPEIIRVRVYVCVQCARAVMIAAAAAAAAAG